MLEKSRNEFETDNSQVNSQSTKRAERRSCWKWTLFILMFFGLQALLWTSAIRLTNKYPSKPITSSGQEIDESKHRLETNEDGK